MYANEGGVLTRRFVPDDLRAAQSSGPNPGASATFSRFLEGFAGGFNVLGGAASIFVFDVVPGCLRARDGKGGGGISCESVRMAGSCELWAL